MQNNSGVDASRQLILRLDKNQLLIVKFGLYGLAFVIFYTFCAGHFDHNDFMYSASAAAHGNLYDDVHFVQAPLTYYALKSINFLSSPDSHYYWLRFASVAFAFSAIIVAAEFCLSQNIPKIGFVFLAATNFHFAISASEIGSYALPMLLTSCAFAALLRTGQSQIASIFCGALIGLATSAKLNYFVFILPAAFLTIVVSRCNRRNNTLPAMLRLMAGFLVGLSPMLFSIANNSQSFISHNIYFHTKFTADFRNQSAIEIFKNVASELSHWLDRGGIYLLLVISWALWRGIYSKIASSFNLISASTFLIAALASAISPMAGFAQYYMPVSFFALLCALLALEHEQHAGAEQNSTAIRLVAVAIFGQQIIYITPDLYNSIRQGSTIAEVAKINTKVADALTGYKQGLCKREIFTFSSSFILDSGLSASKYMEGGPFWSRLNGHIQNRYLMNPAYGIDPLLLDPSKYIQQDHNVGAILVGYYADKPEIGENKIKLAAEEAGFEKIASISTWLSKRPLDLWIKPACILPTDKSSTAGSHPS